LRATLRDQMANTKAASRPKFTTPTTTRSNVPTLWSPINPESVVVTLR
jgi:hypothetical protein